MKILLLTFLLIISYLWGYIFSHSSSSYFFLYLQFFFYLAYSSRWVNKNWREENRHGWKKLLFFFSFFFIASKNLLTERSFLSSSFSTSPSFPSSHLLFEMIRHMKCDRNSVDFFYVTISKTRGNVLSIILNFPTA